MFEWDKTKQKANLKKHGIDFDVVWDFEWPTAIVEPDVRADYGEARFVAYGFIDERLHCLAYTARGKHTRVISLRKANAREQRMYEKETEIFDE
jgi:uncharacterized protein